MSQYWGPPDYPPPQPQYQSPQYQHQSPQYSLQELNADWYYQQSGDSIGKRIVIFLAGSCSTLILVSCCFFMVVIAWVLDTRLGLTTNNDDLIEPTAITGGSMFPTLPITTGTVTIVIPSVNEQPTLSPTPTLMAQLEPFDLGQPIIIPDIGIELVVLDIQRLVQPSNLAAAQGMEFVAVSVQLRDIAPTEVAKSYQIIDFRLQNADSVRYDPDLDADNGRPLQSGFLPNDNIPIEGDLIFHIPQGDSPLFLAWQPSGVAQPYIIALE